MGIVGLTTVGLTTPAAALDAADQSLARTAGTSASAGTDAPGIVAEAEGESQTFVSGGDVDAEPASLDRGGYSAALRQPVVTLPTFVSTGTAGSIILDAAEKAADGAYKAASDTGFKASGWGSNPSPLPAGFSNVSTQYFVNDPGGSVQWPFVVGCPITWGFGWRPGEFHEGADFTPGAGAPIQAIADGTVRMASNGYAGFGAVVIIDHVVDGQRVASLYAHLIVGSITVTAGEHVSVGQVIGKVGASGDAYGANMHFEILQNGTTPVDPVAWLRAHAGA